MANYILYDEDGCEIFTVKNKNDLIEQLMMRQFMDCELVVVK